MLLHSEYFYTMPNYYSHIQGKAQQKKISPLTSSPI